MSEAKQRGSTVLFISEIACLVALLFPTWQGIPQQDGDKQYVFRLGLPFSPWITGTQTWSEAEVAGASDFDGAVQVHFLSWSWLALLLGIMASQMRRRLKNAAEQDAAEQPATSP